MDTYWWDYARSRHIGFVLEHLYFNQQSLMYDNVEDTPSRLIRGGFVRQVIIHQSPPTLFHSLSIVRHILASFTFFR